MKKRMYLGSLSLAAIVVFLISIAFAQLPVSGSLLVMAFQLLAEFGVSILIATVVLNVTSIKRALPVALFACLFARSFREIASIPMILLDTYWWVGILLSIAAVIVAFWLSHYMLNKLAMRLQWKVVLAGLLVVMLAIGAPAASLYAKRMEIAIQGDSQ